MIGPLFEPQALWDAVRIRVDNRQAFAAVITLAIVGGLVVAAANEIGVRVFNTEWNAVLGYSLQRERGWSPFFMLWAAAALLPIVQGVTGAWLLPLYGRPRLWLRAVVVAVVGSLPIYAAAATLVLLPGILAVCVAFLVSCAWWGSGARLLLGVPLGEAADHVAASLVASAALVSLALTAANLS